MNKQKIRTHGKIKRIYQDKYGNIILVADVKQIERVDGDKEVIDKKVKYKFYKTKNYKEVTVYTSINGIYNNEFRGDKTNLLEVQDNSEGLTPSESESILRKKK